MQRRNEITSTGYPTTVWDGGYRSDVGGGGSTQGAYQTSINTCGSRSVDDIDILIDVEWSEPNNPFPEDGTSGIIPDVELSWTDAAMDIEVIIDNNEGSTFNGFLRTYVTEIVSSFGWSNTTGAPYTFPFLDYAFEEPISISSSSSWSNSINWDGKDYNNGQGTDFGSIQQDNIMIIASVFSSADGYVHETAGKEAGINTDPKNYDIYFGNANPPPKIISNQTGTNYDLGILDFGGRDNSAGHIGEQKGPPGLNKSGQIPGNV